VNGKLNQLMLVILGCILLAACSSKPAEPQPPEIVYGQDLCDHCGMIISEARFASATLLENGEFLKFDDLGEMMKYHTKNPQVQVRAWFVHDFPSEAWLRGEEAYYVKNDDLITPMGMGIAAFSEQAEAEAYIGENGGKLFSLEELRAEVHVRMH
jgi:copper chaperone NosL